MRGDRTLARLCEQLEDRIVDLEYERDDALARIAELETQLDDLCACCPRTFAVCPTSPGAS